MKLSETKKCLVCVALALFATTSLGLSTPSPVTPGASLILARRCEEFAKLALQTEQSESARDWAYSWAHTLRSLPIPERLDCIANLPKPLQYRILIADAGMNNPNAPDLRLIDAWRIRGGDLNLVRTDSKNLATAVAEIGFVAPLQWLKDFGVMRLPELDKANELTAASRRINGQWRADWDKTPAIGPTPFEWLLKNDYAWPMEPSAAHELLSNLAVMPNAKLFEEAMNLYGKKNIFSTIIDFDNTESRRPIIYSARSVKAVELLHQWGFNIHAANVDRKKGIVYQTSVLDVSSLPFDVQSALLNLKVSVAGNSVKTTGSLHAALSAQPINLEIVERFLQAGAPLFVPASSRDIGGLVRLHALHFIAEQSVTKFKEGDLPKLIKLLVKYGADPNVLREATTHGDSDNLPIHTAIYSAFWGPGFFRSSDWKPESSTFAIWLEESAIKPEIKHPQLKISLIGYALRRGLYFNAELVNQVIVKLVEIGAPINPTGESLLLEAMKTLRDPNLAIVTKLMDLGASPNQVDAKTGLTVLTHLVTAKPYNTNDCTPRPPHGGSPPACQFETRSQRLERIRWFVARGANPRLRDGNGKSALDLVREFSESDRRSSYEEALLLDAR